MGTMEKEPILQQPELVLQGMKTVWKIADTSSIHHWNTCLHSLNFMTRKRITTSDRGFLFHMRWHSIHIYIIITLISPIICMFVMMIAPFSRLIDSYHNLFQANQLHPQGNHFCPLIATFCPWRPNMWVLQNVTTIPDLPIPAFSTSHLSY